MKTVCAGGWGDQPRHDPPILLKGDPADPAVSHGACPACAAALAATETREADLDAVPAVSYFWSDQPGGRRGTRVRLGARQVAFLGFLDYDVAVREGRIEIENDIRAGHV